MENCFCIFEYHQRVGSYGTNWSVQVPEIVSGWTLINNTLEIWIDTHSININMNTNMYSVIDELKSFGKGRLLPNDVFFGSGDEVCKATVRQGVFDADDELLLHKGMVDYPCPVPGCNTIYESLLLFEMHYNALHRYTCSTCKKPLPSAHLLNLHVAEKHDAYFQAQAERKPMYQCFVEECEEKFSTPKNRRDHCISVHKFPHDFRYDDSWKHKGSDKKKQKKKKKLANTNEVTDVDMDGPGDNTTKKPVVNAVLGKGKRGNKMWHTQSHSVPSTSTDVEFENITQELRESLPDEEMS